MNKTFESKKIETYFEIDLDFIFLSLQHYHSSSFQVNWKNFDY
jgi:hypothetical protein